MDISTYAYNCGNADHTHVYLWKPIIQVLDAAMDSSKSRRVFDLGCGSGAFTQEILVRNYEVCGTDPSTTGIAVARRTYPKIRFEVGSTEEDLAARFGKFRVVTSLEVVEHVYAPRQFAQRVFDLLEPEGVAIISTPYNGYFKNLAIAMLGKYDQHYTALWDNGHIKFWSIKTLGQLLVNAGFEDIKFLRVGRIPVLAKSMIAIARKPR